FVFDNQQAGHGECGMTDTGPILYVGPAAFDYVFVIQAFDRREVRSLDWSATGQAHRRRAACLFPPRLAHPPTRHDPTTRTMTMQASFPTRASDSTRRRLIGGALAATAAATLGMLLP